MSEVDIVKVAEAIEAPPEAVEAVKTWAPNIARWSTMYACARVRLVLDLIDGTHTRRRRTLGMTKRVCEDWSGLLWTENAIVTADEEKTPEALFLEAMFGERFAPLFSTHLERDFAMGFGAVEVLVDDMLVSADGSVLPSADTGIALSMVPAGNIVPLKWSAEGVTEAAFVSASKDYVDVRIYLDGPRVINRRFSADALKEMALPEGIAPEIAFDGAPQLFRCHAPAIANNIDAASPFGMSVFGNAEDHFDTLDLVWDNFGEDFDLGGKMVFLPETMLRRSTTVDDPVTGKKAIIPPQRDKRNLFVALEDPSGGGIAGSPSSIHEHNPTLRVEENAKGLDVALSMVSTAVGMGAERYIYREGAIQTATQIVSENSELFRNRRKHLLAVSSMLADIARAALWCGSNIAGLPLNTEAEVVVRSDDSVIEDDASRQNRGMEKVQAGVMTVERYLVEYEGMAAEDAVKEAAKLAVVTAPPLF